MSPYEFTHALPAIRWLFAKTPKWQETTGSEKCEPVAVASIITAYRLPCGLMKEKQFC